MYLLALHLLLLPKLVNPELSSAYPVMKIIECVLPAHESNWIVLIVTCNVKRVFFWGDLFHLHSRVMEYTVFTEQGIILFASACFYVLNCSSFHTSNAVRPGVRERQLTAVTVPARMSHLRQ